MTNYLTTLQLYGDKGGAGVAVSMDTYKVMLDTYFSKYTDRAVDYRDAIAKYDFVDGIPKQKCFIKLNPAITAD